MTTIKHPLQKGKVTFDILESKLTRWWNKKGRKRFQNKVNGMCAIHNTRPENNYKQFCDIWGLCNECIDEGVGYQTTKSKRVIEILNRKVN